MIDMNNKVAVIPGGATMIGRKVALEFIRAGARVTVCDIDAKGGRELQQEAGAALRFIHADITDDAQVEQVLEQTLEHWGGMDCLVNVACTYLDNGIASTREQWRQALDVNLVSGAIFMQKAAPHMRRRGGELRQYQRQAGATRGACSMPCPRRRSSGLPATRPCCWPGITSASIACPPAGSGPT